MMAFKFSDANTGDQSFRLCVLIERKEREIAITREIIQMDGGWGERVIKEGYIINVNL